MTEESSEEGVQLNCDRSVCSAESVLSMVLLPAGTDAGMSGGVGSGCRRTNRLIITCGKAGEQRDGVGGGGGSRGVPMLPDSL